MKNEEIIELTISAAAVLAVCIEKNSPADARACGESIAEHAGNIAEAGAPVLCPRHRDWLAADIARLRDKPQSLVRQGDLRGTLVAIVTDFAGKEDV